MLTANYFSYTSTMVRYLIHPTSKNLNDPFKMEISCKFDGTCYFTLV